MLNIPVEGNLKTHFLIEYYCIFYTLLEKNNKTKNNIQTVYYNFCFIMFISILTIKYLIKNNKVLKAMKPFLTIFCKSPVAAKIIFLTKK